MWKHFSQIVFLFFQALVCSAHYVYPGLGPIFAHQSQSVFQGSSSFGFGGLPPVSGVHVSAGGKPDASFSGSYGTSGTNGPFPSSSFQAFVQAGSSGGNGWSSVYPESPLPIGKPYPPPDGPISNDLKPSITNWETNYKVPCGTYRIHPAVVAHLRYNSGVPFEIAAMAKSGRHERSAETTTSPPSTSSSSSSSSSREGKHMDLTQYYNLAGTTCTWEFHANGNCELKFACPFFQLPAMYRCDENMIELSDAEHTAYKFCGNRKPRGSYTTSTNNLKLTFSSGPFSLPSVFHCTVTCMPKAETTTTPEPTTTSTTTKKPDPPPTQYGKCKCGVQRSYPTGRVIGGSRTAPGEFPWTVALVKQKSTRPFCGGALINNQYILSAAHCVQRSSMVCDQPNSKKYVADIEVLLNEHDITTVNTIPGGTVRAKVSAITIHPKFDNFTYNYDIAILKLDKAIDFGKAEPACVNGTAGRAITEDVEKLENQFQSQFVPICLPSKARAYTAFDDKQGVVTGWGFTKEDGVPSNSMMQAVVSIFNDSTCQDYFRATDVVTKQMLCAGHAEGKMDSCVGDSGGPLAVKEKEQYTLAGLVSWGRGCGRANLPGVYTRMNGLIEWIESETADAVWCQP